MNIADTRLTCVNVDCVIFSFHIQSDLLALVLASKSCNLGCIKRCDVAGNGIDGLELEVYIIDSKRAVEPFYLFVDKLLWYPGIALYLLLYCAMSEQDFGLTDEQLTLQHLCRLALEFGCHVSNGSGP